MKKVIAALGFLAAAVLATPASAYYDSRPYSHWATGHCKRSSCYARHPGGVYHFPYHYGHRRRY
jgi:hypothetical protein